MTYEQAFVQVHYYIVMRLVYLEKPEHDEAREMFRKQTIHVLNLVLKDMTKIGAQVKTGKLLELVK